MPGIARIMKNFMMYFYFVLFVYFVVSGTFSGK